MAFPQTILPITVALDLNGDGVYETDITQYTRVRNSQGRIRIRRGKQGEAFLGESGECEIELDNRDGRFSPRNPEGPYWGQLSRNTGIQVSVEAGDSYMYIPGDADYAGTPDAAVLDITGDIDIRVEVTFEGDLPQSQSLIGKHGGAGQISYYMIRNPDNGLSLAWSTNGTTLSFYDGVVAIPEPVDRRIAVRATLDVDNGLGGYTVTYYWAPSIDTPTADWIQFDQQVTTSGTTSIHSGTADLRVGDFNTSIANPPVGRIHAAKVYNGIDGTLVANPDFRIQTPGATSFADTTSSPRTWTLASAAEITNKKIRFTGQVSKWPVEWDTSGNDIWTRIEANGLLRQIETSDRPVQSTLRRRLPALTTDMIAYWPMEEREGATRANSPVTGVRHLQISGFDFDEVDGPRGSARLPVVRTGAYISGQVPATNSSTTQWHTEFVFKLDDAPASNVTLLRWAGTGTVRQWELMLRTGFFHVNGDGADGTSVINADHAITNGDVFGHWCRMQLFATQNGGNVDYTIRIIQINGLDALDTGTLSYAGTVGRITAVTGGQPVYGSGADGLGLGHISVWKDADTTVYNDADHAYNGETANSRVIRLASEESFEFEVTDFDPYTTSTAMGSQPLERLIDILREIEESDRGILSESRDFLRIKYISGQNLVNVPQKTSFDYTTDLMPGIIPIDDDRPLGNRFVVINRWGADAEYEKTEGHFSSAAPPNGVGLYSQSSNVNLYNQDEADDHASWLVFKGTLDEARFPNVFYNLARNPELIEDLCSLDVGMRYGITNVPDKMLFNDLDLLLGGYEEEIMQFAWEITHHTESYTPFRQAEVEEDRVDTDASELQAAVNSSATTLVVTATEGPTWTQDTGEFPFDVWMEGERLTVSDISGGAEDDFSDTVADSWASADIGGTWTNAGGASTDYDKTGGRGTHTLTSVNVSRRSRLATAYADVDMTVQIQTSALATGSFLAGMPVARFVDADNMYMARVAFNTDQTVTLTLRKRVAAVETQLATYTSVITHAANTDVKVRFQVQGSTLRARVWANDKPEPTWMWQVTATDTDITTASGVGVRSIANTGNTNVNPVVRFDNFMVHNPTTWTVTRSVNGVTKSQSAGAEVRLWNAPIIALH